MHEAAIGHPQAMVPIARPALVAPLAGPAGCSGAASSAQGHYVQFSHPSVFALRATPDESGRSPRPDDRDSDKAPCEKET